MKRSSPVPSKNSPELPLSRCQPPSNHKKKKTRDLPNLSDCSCCNRRINTTNPKNRLRILTSEWRIVLLCNYCHRLVESSQYCSYCLTSVCSSSIDSFFECERCNRRIHTTCVEKCGIGRGNCDDFSVCFDCWVPELLENEFIRVRGCGIKKKVKICRDLASIGSSRVCDLQDKGKSLEEMVNEAKVAVQGKNVLALEAKEKAEIKTMVAWRAVELASGALSFTTVDERGGEGRGMRVEDDAQLAIRLHRAMNSSPRITRNLCLLNTASLDVPMLQKFEAAGVGADDNSVDMNGLCLVETRQDCAPKGGGMKDEKCNWDSNGCMITYHRREQGSQDGWSKENSDDGILRTYTRRVSCGERHKGAHGHCFKTYSRRQLSNSQCKS